MQELYTIAIAATAVVLVSVVGRALGKRARAASSGGDDAVAAGGGPLIAVIAAAVSAASGMDAGSFSVVGIRPSPAAPGGAPFARSGLNTPVWGHIERFTLGD